MLAGLRSRCQSLNSRNDEVNVRSSDQPNEGEENAAMQDEEGQGNVRSVYYELSSSNNDVTESEVEEDHLACIKIDDNQVEYEEKDEY